MFLTEIMATETQAVMAELLSAGGEDAIQRLDNEHPVRTLYLKIRKREREKRMTEHKEVVKKIKVTKRG